MEFGTSTKTSFGRTQVAKRGYTLFLQYRSEFA